MQRSSADRAAAAPSRSIETTSLIVGPITTRSIPGEVPARLDPTEARSADEIANGGGLTGADLERDVRPPAGRLRPAQGREQFADASRPSAPAKRAASGSYLVISGASELRSPVGTYGRLATTRSNGPAAAATATVP